MRAENMDVLTFEEIAKRMGLSRQRVQQIYARAIRKLKRDGELTSLLALRDALSDTEEHCAF